MARIPFRRVVLVVAGVFGAGCGTVLQMVTAQASSPDPDGAAAVQACMGHLALVTSDDSSDIRKLVDLYRDKTGGSEAEALAARDAAKADAIRNLKAGSWPVSQIESGVWDCYNQFGTNVPSYMDDKVRISAGLGKGPAESDGSQFVSADGNTVGYSSANDPSVRGAPVMTTGQRAAMGSPENPCKAIADRFERMVAESEKANRSPYPIDKYENAVAMCNGTWQVLDDLRANSCPEAKTEEYRLKQVINRSVDIALDQRDRYFPERGFTCNRAPGI